MRNLDRLRCFVMVAKHRHVKRASEVLGFSPSVVSQRIKQLEQAWGVPLFYRRGNRLQLTDAATALVGQARRIVEEVDELDRTARAAAAGTAATVRIAYRHNAARWVTRLARDLTARTPGISIQPMASEHHDVIDALLSREADIGIAGRTDNLEFLELDREPLGRLALPRRHHLATKEVVTIHDLDGESYLIDDRQEHSEPRDEITGFLGAQGVRPDYRPSRLRSSQDLLTLVGAGAGVALVRSSVEGQWAPGHPPGVVFREVQGDVPLILDAALWDPGHAGPVVGRCVEILRRRAATMARAGGPSRAGTAGP